MPPRLKAIGAGWEKAEIENQRVDVVSDGEFIEAGVPVVVTRVDGNRIVVRRYRMSTLPEK